MQFVDRRFVGGAVDQGIEIGVLHAQLDQAAFGGMKIGVQRDLRALRPAAVGFAR